MLREFETTFIVQPEISDEGCKVLSDRLDGLFESHDSVRLIFRDDGKRRLAYEIDDFQKGHYFIVSYFDGGKVVPELERALRLDESVLRFLTVRVADRVGNIEERKKQAEEEERQQAIRAAERAEREAEEAQAREAEAARLRAESEEAAQRAAAADESESAADASADEAPADEVPAGEAPAGEAPADEAPAGEAPPSGDAPAEPTETSEPEEEK